MIPKKTNKVERNEYLSLHYKVQQYYRKHYKYIPFRYIQRKINRKWQIRCYEKNDQVKMEEHQPTIRWSDNIEEVKMF